MIWSVASTGFLTSFALILTIGAQNAFVLKHGILRQHVFLVCLICAVSDALLITAGIAGFGVIVTNYPDFPKMMSIGGAVFLIFYGAMKFIAAYKGGENQSVANTSAVLWPTILTCLTLTWLNPHVYLDTLGLIGAVSTQFEGMPQKLAFGIGAVLASFTFFFSLGYGARYLAPLMKKPVTWQILDVLIGLLMWYLAYGLLIG